MLSKRFKERRLEIATPIGKFPAIVALGFQRLFLLIKLTRCFFLSGVSSSRIFSRVCALDVLVHTLVLLFSFIDTLPAIALHLHIIDQWRYRSGSLILIQFILGYVYHLELKPNNLKHNNSLSLAQNCWILWTRYPEKYAHTEALLRATLTGSLPWLFVVVLSAITGITTGTPVFPYFCKWRPLFPNPSP